jgi:hypothetical protein
VARELERDEGRGVAIAQAVPHALALPPDLGNDCLMGMRLADAPQGTALTFFNELTVRSFRERITYPTGLRRRAELTKRHCEKEAGTQSRLAELANHGLVVSFLALLSFWYLLGWQQALLLAAVVVLHEAGHAAAMRMVGIEVHGIYLVPFFGGVAVPKSSYRSEGRLAFVALMGPGFSLIPTSGWSLRTEGPAIPACSWTPRGSSPSSISPTSCRSIRSTAGGFSTRSSARSAAAWRW